MDASRVGGQPTDRLKALVNCVSYQVYEYIEEATNYDTAIATLRDFFSKAPNEVFAHHLLATAKQELGLTLDEFLLLLQKLAKDCHFRAVAGVQYKQEMIRDAFIDGLTSPGIRQRLLEYRELNLETAVEKPRAMESAQKNCEYYSQSQDIIRSSLSAATLQEKNWKLKPGCEIIAAQPPSTFHVASKASYSVSKLCLFCGRSYHIRSICPARNAMCCKCQKRTFLKRMQIKIRQNYKC